MHMFEPPKQMLTATLALDASGQRLLRTANGFADWLDLGPDPRAVALKMRQVTPTEGPNGLDPIWQSAVSPDGNRVVFGGSSAVRVYESGQITTYAAPRERVLSPDGRLFAVFPSATEKQATIRDTEKGAAQAALAVVPADGHPKPVSALAWSADGTRVATATYYQSEAKSVLNVWEVKTAAHLASVETRRGKIHHMAFSTLAVANADGTIELWDAEKIPAPARK
jgi:WD40 repeat protein